MEFCGILPVQFVAAFHKEGIDFVMPESEGGTDTESRVLMDRFSLILIRIR